MGMNRTFKAAAALIVAVSFAGPVAAGPYEDGLAAYIKGDPATALRLWRPLAEQGFAGAQFFLGMMYVVGQDVPQDYVTAHMWFDGGGWVQRHGASESGRVPNDPRTDRGSAEAGPRVEARPAVRRRLTACPAGGAGRTPPPLIGGYPAGGAGPPSHLPAGCYCARAPSPLALPTDRQWPLAAALKKIKSCRY